MKRKIVDIDREKCNGCGLCVSACHEGAIALVNGKAELVREDYCDGLGNCLPACPAGAITVVERHAEPFDEQAAMRHKENAGRDMTDGEQRHEACANGKHAVKCPGRAMKVLQRNAGSRQVDGAPCESRLSQWPVQLRLVPVNAKFFNNAELLIAADCTAYAYGAFHNDFMDGRVTLIGCPKLDDADYAEKLESILRNNDIRSITVVRMEVPCCGGIEYAVRKAIDKSGRDTPFAVRVISTDGRLLH